MRKFLLLFQVILFTILLISCGNTSTEESNLQYIEEKIKLPVSSFSEIHGKLIDFYTSSNGNIFFLYCKTQDDVNTYTITKKLSNSMLEEQIPLQIDADKNYRFIAVDSHENIFLADTTTLYSFNNESPVSFPIWALGGMIITDDNSVICQTYYDSPYYVFDLSTGSNKGIFLETDLLFEHGKSQPFLDGIYKEEILITSAGIYIHNRNSWNLQIPSKGTSMSKAGFIATGIKKENDGTYIVYDSDYQYVYSSKEMTETEKGQQITLHVTVWQDRDTLRTALTEYQIANPNINIEYTFRCSNLPETKQEANTLLQITNTEIISPQAADLYVLDCLPWEQYQQKGVLMDISDVVAPYANNHEYFGNILNSYETNNSLYAVPWFFSTKYILCKKELEPYVHNIHELAKYLEEHPNEPGLVPYYYRDMPELFLAMMYDFYSDDLYANGIVTLESVENFLSSAKIIYDRQQNNLTATILPKYSKDYYNYAYLQQYPCGTDIQLLFEKQEGNILLLPSTPMGITDLLKVNFHTDYTIVPIDGIHTQFLFGIHSGTDEPEAAKELLRYLLSYFEESGRTDKSIDMFGFLPGFPIYKPILTGQLEKYYISEELVERNPLYNFTTEDTEKLMQLIEKFSYPDQSADTITNDFYSIFEERSRGYLTEERTLTETTNDVYNGLMLLYHESQ